MNIDNAILFLEQLISKKLGRSLRPPEELLLRGSWDGLTYEQMANSSEYSTNYLMRDIGPKLWKALSDAFDEPIGKNNFRTIVERLESSSQSIQLDRQEKASTPSPSLNHTDYLIGTTEAELTVVPVKSGQVSVERLSYRASSLDITSHLSRTQIANVVRNWILNENAQIVGIWGLSGIGKTFLARLITDQVKENFQSVIWCDLGQISSFDVFIKSLPHYLLESAEASNDPLINILNSLQAQRHLLVLDGLETILQSAQLAGHCQSNFTELCKLIRRIGEVPHQSCLILTGLESLKDLATLGGQQASVRSLQLGGVSQSEAIEILSEEQLTAQESWDDLINLYHGHPLAIRAVSKMIRNLFSGNVAEFLHHDYVVFETIEQIFDRTLERLSNLEKEILYWLVSEGKPATLDDIQAGISVVLYPIELLEGLESLKRRSLLEVVYNQGVSQFRVPTVLSRCILRQYVRQVRGNDLSIPSAFRAPQSTENWIRLHPSQSLEVHLDNWFRQVFEPDWQPVDLLFSQAQAPAMRMRSTLHLRGEDMIKRFKQIHLGGGKNDKPVIILVAINREGNELTNICVQAQPGGEATTLPPFLRLLLRDATDTPLAEVQAQEKDSFIQLPYFRGEPQETFSIQLNLNDYSHTEKFVV